MNHQRKRTSRKRLVLLRGMGYDLEDHETAMWKWLDRQDPMAPSRRVDSWLMSLGKYRDKDYISKKQLERAIQIACDYKQIDPLMKDLMK